MNKPHAKLFRQLVKEGKTLRFIRKELKSAGCDLGSKSETQLVKAMLRVRRGDGSVL